MHPRLGAVVFTFSGLGSSRSTSTCAIHIVERDEEHEGEENERHDNHDGLNPSASRALQNQGGKRVNQRCATAGGSEVACQPPPKALMRATRVFRRNASR